MIFISRAVKCPFCEKTFVREEEEYIVHNKRYYHKECYEKKFPNRQEYDELIDYIKKIFKMDIITPLINKQIKDFVKEYKYNYSGMKKTLEYFYEIKGNNIAKARGIGIIPYAYEEAKNYYYNLFLSCQTINKTELLFDKKEIFISYDKKNKIKRKRGLL